MNSEHTAAKPAELQGAGLPSAGSLSRKCSNCGRTGHNSRTCLEHREAAGSASNEGDVIHQVAEQHRQQQAAEKGRDEDDGGASDDSTGVHHREGRKKGVAWTEEEHRLFLLGLQKLGKGDWRGISRHYVQTRSPTQVASHAQKYFIRQSVAGKRKRRSSLFDLVPENTGEVEATSPRTQQGHRVKEEPQIAQRPVELPPLAAAGFPGMVQGADALTLAYWYQAMLAQQHPMAWMHALYGQGQQGSLNMHPAAQIPPLLAPGQGFIPPPLLQQAGFLGLPPTPTASQAGGVPGAGQAFAQALLAHQQQLAAALAVGAAVPFNAEVAQQQPLQQSAEPGGSTTGPSRAFSLPPSRSASALPRSEQPTRHLESEQSRKGPSPSLRRPTAKEGSPHARLLQSSADQSTGGDSTQKASQFASHSRLVRPKAKKAQAVQQGNGEMPSFMLEHPEGGAGASGSGESHDTATLRAHPRFGALPSELSGSTNGGFSGSSTGLLPAAAVSADEQSATLGAKPPPRPPTRPSPSLLRERLLAEEFAPGSFTASKQSGSDDSPPG